MHVEALVEDIVVHAAIVVIVVIIVGRRLSLGCLAVAALVVIARPSARASIIVALKLDAKVEAVCALCRHFFASCLDQARTNSKLTG
jgi:hypothetical protein